MARPRTGATSANCAPPLFHRAQESSVLARAPGSFRIQGEARSGKTDLLIKRAAHWLRDLGIQPSSLTVLVQAEQRQFFAKRLHARIGDLAAQISVETLVEHGQKLLRELHARIALKKSFAVATRQEQVDVLAQSCGMDPDQASPWAARIGEHKRGGPADEILRRHRLCYDSALRLRQQVDANDLLLLPALLIAGDQILQTRLHARHRFVLVDDAHRLDSLEHRLLSLLLAPDAECWATWLSAPSAARPTRETSWLPAAHVDLQVSRGQMTFDFGKTKGGLRSTP